MHYRNLHFQSPSKGIPLLCAIIDKGPEGALRRALRWVEAGLHMFNPENKSGEGEGGLGLEGIIVRLH